VGWRGAYLVLGGFAAVIGVGMSWFIADNPRDRGTGPDGVAPEAGEPVVAAGASVGEAIRSRQFAALYAACLICSFGVFVPFVHLVPYALDHHVDQSAAVLLLGAIGVGSTLGRFFLGGLADRIGRQSFLVMMFVGMAAALAIWVLATTFWSLTAFALLFGLFYGGWVAILPAVVMDHFGGRNVSGIIGILYTSVAIGTLIGPGAAGFIFDMSHSYTLAILASAGANVIAAAVATLAKRKEITPAT
jgi:MFS family permease